TIWPRRPWDSCAVGGTTSQSPTCACIRSSSYLPPMLLPEHNGRTGRWSPILTAEVPAVSDRHRAPGSSPGRQVALEDDVRVADAAVPRGLGGGIDHRGRAADVDVRGLGPARERLLQSIHRRAHRAGPVRSRPPYRRRDGEVGELGTRRG